MDALVSDWKDEDLPSREGGGPPSQEPASVNPSSQSSALEVPVGPRRERAASVGGFSHVIVSRVGVHGRKHGARPSHLVGTILFLSVA